MKRIKILFLCSDNFTRSVTAEFCLKDFLEKRNIDHIQVSSAGTDADSDISKHFATHFDRMKELGIDASAFTRTQFDENLLNDTDIIIAMAQEHQDFVLENFGISIPLYNEMVSGEKTSVVVSRPDSEDDVQKQIRDMTDYIHGSTPAFFEHIITHHKDS
jgi:protein-tyrosine phosphatase